MKTNSKSNSIATVNATSIATVNATSTATVKVVDNSTKVNKLLTVSELTVLCTECGLLPRFVCDGYYVGVGVGRTNHFSINTRSKWSTYKIFCDTDRFDQLKKSKIDGITLTANGNATDKVRPNVIEVKTTETLKKVLMFIASQNKSFCLTK